MVIGEKTFRSIFSCKRHIFKYQLIENMKKLVLVILIFFSTYSLRCQHEKKHLEDVFKTALHKADSLSNIGLFAQSNNTIYPFLQKSLTPINLYLSHDRILQNHGIVLQHDSIQLYLKKTKKIIQQDSLSNFIGQSLFREGHSLLIQNKNTEAINFFIESLKIAEDSEDLFLRSQNYNAIGSILFSNRNYQEAISYFNKTIGLTSSNNPSGLCGVAHNLKAQSLFALNQYDQTLEEIQAAQPYLIHKIDIIVNKILLAQLYSHTKQQFKAYNHTMEALRLMGQIESFKSLEALQATITDINSETDHSILKKVHLYEKDISSILKYNTGRNAYYEARKSIAEQDNNDKAQIAELKSLLSIRDSLYNLEKEKAIEEINTKFNTEKKEKDILALQKSNLQKELLISKERNRKLLYAVTTIIVLIGFFMFSAYVNNRKKRMLLQKEMDIVKAKQLENDRIGANLHDQNANLLRGIAQELTEQGNNIVSEKISNIETSLRNLSRELVSIPFEDSSFENQIITLGSKYHNDDFKVKIHGLKNISWKQVNTVVKRNLFLVIREGIVNAVKHSGADQFDMTFSQKGTNIQVQLQDNGFGIKSNPSSEGIGMRNMKVRINEIRGTIKFKSIPSKGTLVQITLAV